MKISNSGTLQDKRGRVKVTTTHKRVKAAPATIAASFGPDGEVVLKKSADASRPKRR